MKGPHFGRFFERNPDGKPYTLRQLLGVGETEKNQTSKQGKNMKKNLDDGCPDGIDSSLQARTLEKKQLNGLALWRSLSDNCRTAIYMLIGLPAVGAILLALLFHSHMWFTAH